MKKKHTSMETEIRAVYHQIKGLNQNLNNCLEALESRIEYIENHSRGNNIKITGAEEKADKKTWDNTEKVAKESSKKSLEEREKEGEIVIERAHRVGEYLNHAPAAMLIQTRTQVEAMEINIRQAPTSFQGVSAIKRLQL